MTNIYENLLGTLYKGTPYGSELAVKVGHQTKTKFKFDQSKIPFLLRWVKSGTNNWHQPNGLKNEKT